MVTRSEIHQAFVKRFHAGKRVRPATEAQLADAEGALSVVWPESYRQFALVCGAPYSPGLLDLVNARSPGFGEVQQFLTLRQSVTETRRWQLEPERGCAAFASDCSGNFFAFRQLSAAEPRADDAVVWLFDHEAGTVIQQAPSFDQWLSQFLSL